MDAFERPLCKCHGQIMSWHKDARRSKGGYWRCREKRRQRERTRKLSDLIDENIALDLVFLCESIQIEMLGELIWSSREVYRKIDKIIEYFSDEKVQRATRKLSNEGIARVLFLEERKRLEREVNKAHVEAIEEDKRRTREAKEAAKRELRERRRERVAEYRYWDSRRVKEMLRAVEDKHSINVIEKIDLRRAQLMRLAADRGATLYERQRALEVLDKHNVKQATKEPTCQHSQITSAGTPTPLLLPRSTSF